jgi:hypothetical protein
MRSDGPNASLHPAARLRPSCACLFRPGGRGECRAPSAPAASCAKWVVQNAHEYSQRSHRKSPGIPARNGLRLTSRSPRRSGFLVTVASRILARPPGRARAPPRDLTPASRRQDHTTSPSASAPFVCAHSDRSRETRPAIALRAGTAASTASLPAYVTIMIRPSLGVGWRELVEMICPTGKAKNFLRRGWTLICPTGCFCTSRLKHHASVRT